jgi:beta-lactamase superfamily II metal-dependent hydrolase
MKIHFVNVGNGDAILLQSEAHNNSLARTILVDTGTARESEYTEPRIRISKYLKAKGIRKLDLLILSHPHDDHIAMTIPLMDICEISEIWVNHLLPEAAWGKQIDEQSVKDAEFLISSLNVYSRILKMARERGIPVIEKKGDGSTYQLSDFLSVRLMNHLKIEDHSFGKRLQKIFDSNGNVLTEDNAVREELILLNRECNASSLALIFTENGRQLLLTGDSCGENWSSGFLQELSQMDIDVFKLPHHGQNDSINEEGAVAVSPKIVVTTGNSDWKSDYSYPASYHLIKNSLNYSPQFLFSDKKRSEFYFNVTSLVRALIIDLPEGTDSIVEFDEIPDLVTENRRS